MIKLVNFFVFEKLLFYGFNAHMTYFIVVVDEDSFIYRERYYLKSFLYSVIKCEFETNCL